MLNLRKPIVGREATVLEIAVQGAEKEQHVVRDVNVNKTVHMQIGTKVVCIDPITDPLTGIGIKYGNTYEITDTRECTCGQLLVAVGQLIEIPTECVCNLRHETGEKLYKAERFVPLTEWDDLSDTLNEAMSEIFQEELEFI